MYSHPPALQFSGPTVRSLINSLTWDFKYMISNWFPYLMFHILNPELFSSIVQKQQLVTAWVPALRPRGVKRKFLILAIFMYTVHFWAMFSLGKDVGLGAWTGNVMAFFFVLLNFALASSMPHMILFSILAFYVAQCISVERKRLSLDLQHKNTTGLCYIPFCTAQKIGHIHCTN